MVCEHLWQSLLPQLQKGAASDWEVGAGLLPDGVGDQHSQAAQRLALSVHGVPGLVDGVDIRARGVVRLVPQVRPQAGHLPLRLQASRGCATQDGG